MKRKTTTILTALLVTISLLFVSCAALTADKKAPAVTREGTEEAVTVEAPRKETVSFEVTDAAGNKLSLIPIYNADAVTVIAGYVESATDKTGAPLTAEALPVIGGIVGVTEHNGVFSLDRDSNGNTLRVEAYADENGNIIAMQDVKDLNQNADTEEFLKLNLVTDANGIRRYMTEYTAVAIVKAGDGSAEAIVDGERQNASAVKADNTKVINRMQEDKKKNEQQKAANTKQKVNADKRAVTASDKQSKKKKKKKASGDAASASSDKEKETTSDDKDSAGESDVSDKPEESPVSGIVLLANRTARSDAPGVEISTGMVSITEPGDYEITSETDVWHGQIEVKLPHTEKAEIAFRNVRIQNNTTNIIRILDADIQEDRSFLEAESSAEEYAENYVETLSEYDMAPNVQLSFPEGTSSEFITTANSHTGVLYNESKLTIKGHGSAAFGSVRNPNNGICSTKSIKIRNLRLKLTTPQNENTSVLDKTTGSAKGIFSYSRVTVESGSLTVKTNGDGIRCQKLDIEGGSLDIASSACDGIDADDRIVIADATVKVTALQKSSFKVRRINNTEKGYVKGRMRADKGDTFEINSGSTVIAESKRISTVQPTSSQPSLTCRIVKPSAGTQAALLETKTPAIIRIEGVRTSVNKCTKFLYASPSLTKGRLYTAYAGGNATTMTAADWNRNAGTIKVISAQDTAE